MPPKGKGRKRTCDAASLVGELSREVDTSMAADEDLIGAFLSMSSTHLPLDGEKLCETSDNLKLLFDFGSYEYIF